MVTNKRETAINQCLKEVEDVLKSDLKYGSVTIVIQDGIPIQLETTEKKRFK